jgi:hypothetical protein
MSPKLMFFALFWRYKDIFLGHKPKTSPKISLFGTEILYIFLPFLLLQRKNKTIK